MSLVSTETSVKTHRSIRGRNPSLRSIHKPKKIIGDYIIGKTLGKGASGRVKLGIHKITGDHVAIKIISKNHLTANPTIQKAVRREIAIMKLIQHPNIMSLIDVIDDPASSDLYLVLEYIEGGELFEYLVKKGRLCEAEARHHFQQIILGLDYCHHHLICHRDLKPENLLLNSKNNIKIADFGMASLQPVGSMLETSCGSPHYASPEIITGLPYHGPSSDIWSCGVILYALLTGYLPFDDENMRQLLKKVKTGKYHLPSHLSETAKDLIQKILVVDPLKRLSMKQIINHPWFIETKPFNFKNLPVPPTESQIVQPVKNRSEIDERLLDTIQFLWGETQHETIIQALLEKEHNMQKVIYVLLQKQAERYWQSNHEDESDEDVSDSVRYSRNLDRKERDRKCLSYIDENKKGNSTIRMLRRFSTIRSKPPSTKIKKTESVYKNFKNTITPTLKEPKHPESGWVGTLRILNPFQTKTIDDQPAKSQTISNRVNKRKQLDQVIFQPPGLSDSSSQSDASSLSQPISLIDQSTKKPNYQTKSQLSAQSDLQPTCSDSEIKSSWLNHLFFFKQPRICNLVVHCQDKDSILKTLYKLMNLSYQTRFYEKLDRTGQTRHKLEIKIQKDKVHQIKCKIEFTISKFTTIHFVQQQGDGILLNFIIQSLHEPMSKEYPLK